MEAMAALEENISKVQEYVLSGEGKKRKNEAGNVKRGQIVRGL